MSDDLEDDIRAIRTLIMRQFASLNWRAGEPADWDAFTADFAPGATLHPAARPAQSQSVSAFVARMQGVAAKLHTFNEKLLGVEIRVFGNVAVAAAACEITENSADVSRSVEMLLLVKDGDTWKIVAQAWDAEKPSTPIPPALLTMSGSGAD